MQPFVQMSAWVPFIAFAVRTQDRMRLHPHLSPLLPKRVHVSQGRNFAAEFTVQENDKEKDDTNGD